MNAASPSKTPSVRHSTASTASSIPYADGSMESNLNALEAGELPQQQQQQETPALAQALETVKRKISLSERRNVDLSIIVRVNEKDLTNKDLSNKQLSHETSTEALSTANSPGIVIKVENVPVNLRRNSISLPSGINALDLEALRLCHQMRSQETLSEEEQSGSASTPLMDSVPEDISQADALIDPAKVVFAASSSASKDDEADSDSDLFDNGRRPVYRDRFRSRRRASIAPLPSLRLNSREMLASDFDTHSLASNQASITSINSLASLLREKMQGYSQMIRKKKRDTKDYKIKIFVLMMFFTIMFLIGYSYVTYHTQVLTKSYFEKIKFNPKTRHFFILSHEEKEVIFGRLGVTIGYDTAPFHCLEENRRRDGSVCIEWNGLARMYMNYHDMDVFRCYTIQWQALGEGVHPTDCYDVTREGGLWFGGGVTRTMDWSLSQANFDFAPFTSGDPRVHQFGNGVKRYFINSIGVAMQVNERTPLHIGVNHTTNEFCLRAMNDDFTFVNRLTPLPELEYKICTTEDMRSLHMLMTQQSLWDGLRETDLQQLHSLLEEPVWKIPFQSEMSSLNETTIYAYSEEVNAMGFMRQGHILVNEFWQENIGDFTVDVTRFPTLKDTIDVLHRRGFKIVFTLQPFISTDSLNFKEAVRDKLLIYERHSERSIPALTRYKSSTSAGMLDITKNASVPWLLQKLVALKESYKLDSFYLDLGTAYNLPHYYQCRKTLDNPDMYLRIFTESLKDIGFIGVSAANSVPKPPAFLSIPPINSSWEGLRESLTTVLIYGVIGYPFVLPGAIGGDYMLEEPAKKMISFHSLGQPALPEAELFVRWMQLMTFMPSIQFSHLPSEYKSDHMMDIAKELIEIRQKTVIPLLKKYLSQSMNEGLPLVRPLWMLDPRDPACLMISDEFSVGEELIVAPILERDSDEREVYLPQGVWKDGIDSSMRKGSRWLHNYKVAKEKIAFFIKMPDNTRF